MLDKKAQGAGGAGGAVFAANLSSNTQELNLASWANSQGWDGSSKAEITIDSGVYVWSDNTSIAALTTGNFPNGLTLIVEGYIIGRGGDAPDRTSEGGGGNTYLNTGTINGGSAISLGCDIIIKGSSGYIGGGGGAGEGTGGPVSTLTLNLSGSGGAGGGSGGDWRNETNTAIVEVAGGAGGSIGNVGANGAHQSGSSESPNILGKGGGAGGGGSGYSDQY